MQRTLNELILLAVGLAEAELRGDSEARAALVDGVHPADVAFLLGQLFCRYAEATADGPLPLAEYLEHHRQLALRAIAGGEDRA